MSGRLHRPLIVMAVLVLTLPLRPPESSAGEILESTWRKASVKAKSLMKEPGQRIAKQELIALIGRDDSLRAAELLVKWAVRSYKLQQRHIAKELAEAEKAFDKIEKFMLRFYEKMPPTRVKDKNAWLRLKKIRDGFRAQDRGEDGVRFSIGEALHWMTNAEAVAYLTSDGLRAIQKAKGSGGLQVAVARGLMQQPVDRVRDAALRFAGDVKRPKIRILGVNWIGQHKEAAGFGALVTALSAKEVAVRRAAVFALKALDDKRAIAPLIAAMQKARAQLNTDIDEVLYWFTGKTFEGSAPVWKRWWTNEGPAWLAGATKQRHQRKGKKLPGGTLVRFYGIPTESHHVVFVLDRSGSMKHKASDRSIQKKKREQAPVTGAKPKGPAARSNEAVPGDTRMEVAKNQLARSVDEIDRKVKFNVVFYSSKVEVWKPAPELMESTRPNREAAKKWFMGLKAEGSTHLFDALMTALDYADTIGQDKKKQRTGADTIFLLTDGTPATDDGQLLPPEVLEAKYAAFLKKNEMYHCIVHTIGIGPGHDSRLLRRLAADTGGQYKAVGGR